MCLYLSQEARGNWNLMLTKPVHKLWHTNEQVLTWEWSAEQSARHTTRPLLCVPFRSFLSFLNLTYSEGGVLRTLGGWTLNEWIKTMRFHYLFKDLSSSIENENDNIDKIKIKIFIIGQFRLTTTCVCETFRVSGAGCRADSLSITVKLAEQQAKGLSRIL